MTLLLVRGAVSCHSPCVCGCFFADGELRCAAVPLYLFCTVLVMTGDRDVIVPAWNARRVAASVPGSTFEMIPECGHVPQEEKVEEVLRRIMEFLQKKEVQ